MNRGIPQDRDCLTAVPTGGVETSKHISSLRDVYLAQERALFSSEAVVCDKRENARSLVVSLKEPVSRRIFPKNIFCALCYLSVCCLAIVGQTWSEALLFPSGSQLSEVVLLFQTFYRL